MLRLTHLSELKTLKVIDKVPVVPKILLKLEEDLKTLNNPSIKKIVGI